MVRLHVVHNKIIRLSIGKSLFQILLPLCGAAGVHGVHDCNLLILDEIGVVCHALLKDVLAFEKVKVEVIGPDIIDGIADSFHNLHFLAVQKYEELHTKAKMIIFVSRLTS